MMLCHGRYPSCGEAGGLSCTILCLDVYCDLTGVSGTVQLDSNGDRIGDYWLWHIPQRRSTYEKWGEVRMTDREVGNEVWKFPDICRILEFI